MVITNGQDINVKKYGDITCSATGSQLREDFIHIQYSRDIPPLNEAGLFWGRFAVFEVMECLGFGQPGGSLRSLYSR